MIAWPGRPDDAMECGAEAFPASDPPWCVEHILGEMLDRTHAYQAGVDAARKVWPRRAEGRTINDLIAEANQVLAVLEGGGGQAVRTRGYRDTLENYRNTMITTAKEGQG
jgi:hypothetical protein